MTIASLTIAGLSLVISGIAVGWNVFRDFVDKPKIKIKAYIAHVNPLEEIYETDMQTKMYEISPSAHCINPEAVSYYTKMINEPKDVLCIEVINIGKKPCVINLHEFRLNPSNDSNDEKKWDGLVIKSIMEDFHNKKLNPYEFFQVSVPFEKLEEFSEKIEDIQSFYIYDTCGKGWKLPDQDLKKLKHDLIKVKQKS